MKHVFQILSAAFALLLATLAQAMPAGFSFPSIDGGTIELGPSPLGGLSVRITFPREGHPGPGRPAV